MYSSKYARYKPELTLNNKGADAFVSTTNPVLDLFTYTNKTLNTDYDSFKELINTIINAKNFNSELFIKLLKFQRLIKKGNGNKHVYYLCMMMIKMEAPSLYAKLLEWSYEYPKDILFLNRVNSMYNPTSNTNGQTISLNGNYKSITTPKSLKMNIFLSKMKKSNIIIGQDISISEEVKTYGEIVFSNFIKILSGSDNYNPMLIKYLSYETGHWIVETEQIWKYVEYLASIDETFNNLVQSNDNINEFATKFRDILKNNKYGNIYFTNKNKRLIKKLFNSHVNLTDNLYKGIHTDETKFGTKTNVADEIELIYQVIKKTPAKSLQILTKYIRKKSTSPEQKHILLNKGYQKYLEKLEKKEVKVKTTGLDITSECMQFYMDIPVYDIKLENQLQQIYDELKNFIIPSFTEDFTFENFASKIVPVIDISGSMDGVPIQTGLLYFVLMVKLFGVKSLYYFESISSKIELSQEDIDGTFCSLIKKVYTRVRGSTNLQSIFTRLEEEKASNKIVLIITDGDCDPSYNSKNPFHDVTCGKTYKYISNNNYVVINVKQEKMNFPYLGIDPKVCYVTGNNPKTINGLIKSMVVAQRDSISITPELILQYSLDLVELSLPEVPPVLTRVFSEDDYVKLHKVFISCLPPSKIIEKDNEDNQNYENNQNYEYNEDNEDNEDNHNIDDLIEDVDDDIYNYNRYSALENVD